MAETIKNSNGTLTTILGKDNCPQCGYLCDAATGIDKEDQSVPVPGDLSVCFNCGAMLEFASDMALKTLSVGRLMELDDESAIELIAASTLIQIRNGKKYRPDEV